MTQIELMEHVLDNLKNGRRHGSGLFVSGIESSADSFWGITWDSPSGYTKKPRTRTVNGFEVPAPESDGLIYGERYYIPDPIYISNLSWIYAATWNDHRRDRERLRRGLVFKTKEAAIANAKAMVGIDPYKEDTNDNQN